MDVLTFVGVGNHGPVSAQPHLQLCMFGVTCLDFLFGFHFKFFHTLIACQ